MFDTILNWLIQNYIEVLGTVTGLIYLVFSIRQNILLWPLGILTSALYILVFFQSKFYADMGLQVYYLFISFYGWYNWLYGNPESNDTSLKVTRASKMLLIKLIPVSIIIFAVISFILVKFTDSPLPYWDAFTTAASIIATWMLAKKIIEHWLIWIVVDAVSMGLYIYKDLYPTTLLFFVYTSMAILGYITWKKELQKIEQTI
ncbi:MAG: nicotinamide mononucleotide transporter [Bacteroidales bacterium]|nr:nicotinamide mononucleotide transporter [Bacteroidales bacterium]